ncbi:2-keto-4-pentenoate hydratase [Sphingomonas koreensis]
MTKGMSRAAGALVEARRTATGLPAYPGALPVSLAEAYTVQAEAAGLWGDRVAGWKVGRITGEAERRFRKNRFIGPMFAGTVEEIAVGEKGAFPVIRGGSSALEAEVVAILGHDVAPRRSDWTPEEVRPLLCELRIAIEVAGSPVLHVNDLGALASIASFGNNLGLILGPAIRAWQEVGLDTIACQTIIDGAVAGSATVSSLPGGLLTAVAFALNQATQLEIGLSAGSMLSTGAITGVHAIKIGQRCEADFGAFGRLRCDTFAALPA